MKSFREPIFAILTIAAIASLIYLDPDPGAPSTVVWLHRLGLSVLVVWMIHWLLKLTQPYINREELHSNASMTPLGSGLALIAAAIMWLAIALIVGPVARAQDVATYIPASAQTHLPTLKHEQATHWPAHPEPHLLASLIEHESCTSLKHSRCWSPTSRLKSAREEGAGLGQLTRAYRTDGSTRFDALAEARAKHPSLSEMSWSNIYQRPDLQLRTVVLMMRDLSRAMPAGDANLHFADAAYNGGAGGVQADRRACALRSGCNAQIWFGHVEHACTKSRAALYGQRSACDINRHHVRDVIVTRATKYRAAWAGLAVT